jgi:hypothetical protein
VFRHHFSGDQSDYQQQAGRNENQVVEISGYGDEVGIRSIGRNRYPSTQAAGALEGHLKELLPLENRFLTYRKIKNRFRNESQLAAVVFIDCLALLWKTGPHKAFLP